MSLYRPNAADPERLAEVVGDAEVVGLGMSTRSGRETFGFVERTTRRLLERGFRTIAVRDNQRIGALYDAFVSGGRDRLDEILPQAWGPWQTTEFHTALVGLRSFNAGRAAGDRVRVIGIGSSQVLVADYDRVLDLLAAHPGAATQEQVAGVRARFDVIRVAHANGEHVQRARGIHPGPPFVELARQAQTVVAQAGPEAAQLMAAIVAHHANAIGAGFDAKREDAETAGRLLAEYRRTGRRTVLWEGSAHVAAQFPLGARLRTALGPGYRAVHVTFGSGKVADFEVPSPAPGSLEHDLLTTSSGPGLFELAAAEGPTRVRLISGVYDPARDHEHYYEIPSLGASFDAVVFFPEETSTSWFRPGARPV